MEAGLERAGGASDEAEQEKIAARREPPAPAADQRGAAEHEMEQVVAAVRYGPPADDTEAREARVTELAAAFGRAHQALADNGVLAEESTVWLRGRRRHGS